MNQNSNLNTETPSGAYCQFRGERFYRIENAQTMPTFFMSIVSAFDHWLFIASNGGLTAGRQNSEKSLFPYYTEDKLVDMAHCTGPLTLVKENGSLWQPLGDASYMQTPNPRVLLKSALGDKLYFQEEHNGLLFEQGWSFSERFGLVRTVKLQNNSSETRALNLIDGLQNVLPANVDTQVQNQTSVLLDAYKTTQLTDTNLAIYSLSSRLTDVAEPSESLFANTVWHCISAGSASFKATIDPEAAKHFARNNAVEHKDRVRGQRGCYFVEGALTLAPGEYAEWLMVAEVQQDISSIQRLEANRSDENIAQQIAEDIQVGQQALRGRVAKVDGLQLCGPETTATHHAANALFNCMRGGLFEDGYQINRADLQSFVATRNKKLTDHPFWQGLPESITLAALKEKLTGCDCADLNRLVTEYLPISFSRRHGDPSRPWNKFSINLKDDTGKEIKDYQGNWRDIFQNWEPLALTYPEFLPSMISAFLNATTADGYNPYRVTRNGIEWEEPEPENPWSNIGYWSDHQIIYLSKLLELLEKQNPDQVASWLTAESFSYANVPYRIKNFAELKKDPYNSIEFDHELNNKIVARVSELGSDGKLLADGQGKVQHANLVEKLLTLWLAKLSNFVPGGGIWMNTQRPEWNDANNALVGYGLSVVTLAYLNRHLQFFRKVLFTRQRTIAVRSEVAGWLKATETALTNIGDVKDSVARMAHMEALVGAADRYREGVYSHGLGREFSEVSSAELVQFIDIALEKIQQTLAANERYDGLYHSYNLVDFSAAEAAVNYLPEMLEGQVAMLSADFLSAEKSLNLLTSLRSSNLYREDQHTYLLYPNKELTEFLLKNQVDQEAFGLVDGAQALLESGIVFKQSLDGQIHFNSTLRNNKDLRKLLEAEKVAVPLQQQVLDLYEATFNHKSFTGRSGSFFAYEGLGSTYWHMVSKLLLAVQENWFAAKARGADVAVIQGLKSCYYDIRSGIGFNKTPAQYGAFPTDPYSHTPETGIARQPGMTGQVKEELLTRFGELGIVWQNQTIAFVPGLLNSEEFLAEPVDFEYLSVNGEWQSINVNIGSLAFTVAQVPFVYSKTSGPLSFRVLYADGQMEAYESSVLPEAVYSDIARRNGNVERIEVNFPVL
ncbi:hypothetical protein [Reinekea marinisedimentorum]|uniref:Cellobiose phosphorylase n=1 Tax=Reinekea marinisedimentorum TaxID=230495 RepID=A0A4R3I052_9GAMM|nr:hypothetical protein [Reinekea marinisedimentorum]TCS38902.1 hypothetical protein BCF53_11467 [Reinekea marinisedimentorum]